MVMTARHRVSHVVLQSAMSFAVAFFHAIANQGGDGLGVQSGQVVGKNRTTVVDPDRMRNRNQPRPRPDLEHAGQAGRDDRNTDPLHQHGDARFERLPSWPSWLRVPSGKRVTIPPPRSRRSVSFMPEAPIPSRWIGKPPTDRMNQPSTGTKSVDRAT